MLFGSDSSPDISATIPYSTLSPSDSSIMDTSSTYPTLPVLACILHSCSIPYSAFSSSFP